MKIEMFIKSVSEALQEATHEELLALASWCQKEANRRNPIRIAYEKQLQESMNKYQAEQDRKDAEERALVVKLKGFLKPGMKLKMRGCKDGHGIREFIKWENDNLVCWQLQVTRRRVANGYSRFEERTNQVTTHMANKVKLIFVDGTGLQVKSILK